ncbi:MAG: hypothetical protein IPM39_06650 [Chloroflexi bacterium]|nr:hypothetical protein [Chloroflexota bacterium]
MKQDPITLTPNNIHQLWETLTAELTGIFDAHYVCATVATEVARHTNTTTVVGISDPGRHYYDVWVCDPQGNVQQSRWDPQRATFDPLLDKGRAAYQDKFTLPPGQLVSSALWQLPRERILAVPMPLPGHSDPVTPPGILCLIDPGGDCFLNLDNIEPLVANMTVFLDRAYLRQQVHRQNIEFSVVSDISFALTSTLSLQKIYEQLIDPVRRTLIVETISVGLIDATSGDITFVQTLLGPMFANLPPVHIKKGQGIAGWVAEHGQAVIINDVYPTSASLPV